MHSKWVTYGLVRRGVSNQAFENGTWTAYELHRSVLADEGSGKPGEFGSSVQVSCTPRSLKLCAAKFASSKAGMLKVSWKPPRNPSAVKGYVVRYACNKSMKEAKEMEVGSGTSATFEGIKKGKRVYAQVAIIQEAVNSARLSRCVGDGWR